MRNTQRDLSRIDESFLKQYEELDEPGQPIMLQVLIGHFLESAPGRLVILTQALDQRESHSIRFEAHALKNAATSLGATALAGLFNILETQGTEGNFEGIESILCDVTKEYEAVVQELKKKLL
jgi:HPt (histidine-containing phosphotransfer) domain-containing protein